MPGVEVVADGDHVAELIVCVSGSLEALDVDGNSGKPNSSSHGGGRYGSMGYDSSLRGGDAFIGGPGGSPAVMAAGGGSWPAPAAPGSGAAFPRSADSSLQGGAVPGPASDNPEAGLSPTIVASASRAQADSFHLPSLAVARQLGEGDAVGEVSFFTEVPQCGAVRTLTVARVLCIPRARYEVIARDFPLGTRAVLENLRKRAAAVVDAAFGGDQLAAAAATAQAQQAQQAQDSTAAAAAAGAGGSTAALPKGAALGASGWRSELQVVVPTARSGLATAVILGLARAIGEASPILLTAGYTTYLNANPLKGSMTSLSLATLKLVQAGVPAYTSRAFGCASILLILVIVLFAIARKIGGWGPGHLTPRARRRVEAESARDLARFSARPTPSLVTADTAASDTRTS